MFSTKSRYYRMILSCTLAVSLIPAIAIGFMLGGRMFVQSAKAYEEIELAAFNQKINTVEQKMRNVESAVFQLCVNQDVLRFIRSDDTVRDYQYFNRLREVCVSLMHVRPGDFTIDNIVIANRSKNWIYDAEVGLQSADAIPEAIRERYSSPADDWGLEERYVKNNSFEYIASDRTLTRYMWVLGDSVVATMINYDNFRAALSDISPVSDFYLIEDGQLFYSTTGETPGSSAKGFAFYEGLSGDGGEFTYKQGGTEYHCLYTRSPDFGWYYVLNRENALGAPNFYASMAVSFLPAITVVVCVILLDAILSHRLYKPIRDLYASIAGPLSESAKNGQRRYDEVKLLEASFLDLTGDNQLLRQQMGAQRTFMRELLIYRLLTGRIEKKAEQGRLAEYDISLPWKHKILIAIRLPAEACQNDHELRDAYFAGVTQHVRAYLPADTLVAPGLIEDMAVMVTGWDGSYASDMIGKLLTEAYQGVVSTLGFDVAITASMGFDSVERIGIAFERIRDVLRYRGGCGVLWPQGGKSNAQYPYRHVEDAVEGVKLHNPPKAQESILAFFRAIGQNAVDVDSRQMFALWMIGDLLRLVPEQGGEIMNRISAKQGSLQQAVFQWQTPEEMADWVMKNIVEPVMNLLHADNANKTVLVQQMIEYLQERTGSQDWGISYCAEQLNYHVSYLRKVFKEKTGVSYGQYANSLLLRRAETLLCESGLSVSEIAVQLGFSNSQNFIRQFRKEHNMTPGQYRNRYKPGDAL